MTSADASNASSSSESSSNGSCPDFARMRNDTVDVVIFHQDAFAALPTRTGHQNLRRDPGLAGRALFLGQLHAVH